MKMDNKSQTELSGQELLIFILQNVVKDVGNCPLVRQRLIDNQSKYPFVTFNWIILEKELTQDWLGNDRAYYAQLQIDVHADDYLKALELARKLFSSLKRDKYLLYFEQVEMVPSQLTTIEDRTLAPDVNYDYCFGFDCTFLINNDHKYKLSDLRFDFTETTIDTVATKEKAENNNIDNNNRRKNNGRSI